MNRCACGHEIIHHAWTVPKRCTKSDCPCPRFRPTRRARLSQDAFAQGLAEGAERQREADAKILVDVRYYGASLPFMAKLLRTTPCVQMRDSIMTPPPDRTLAQQVEKPDWLIEAQQFAELSDKENGLKCIEKGTLAHHLRRVIKEYNTLISLCRTREGR